MYVVSSPYHKVHDEGPFSLSYRSRRHLVLAFWAPLLLKIGMAPGLPWDWLSRKWVHCMSGKVYAAAIAGEHRGHVSDTYLWTITHMKQFVNK